MKCDRLISLIKNWYLKVQEEAMAPARMVAFMEKHIAQCEECLADPDVKQEADKIREIVLPPPKALKPKVARVPKEDVEDADADAETEDETSEDEDEVEDNDDEEDDFDSVDIMADDEI
jgi:hypothetical protein